MSLLVADTVAKLFLRPNRAILIQDRAQAHNIDSSSIRSNSIIARSRRSKEFCNTIGTKETCCSLVPSVGLRAKSGHAFEAA
jgi:hypothetical protein